MRSVLCALRRHAVIVDVAIAVIFVALDTAVTLTGGSWWPAQPDGLAWALLVAMWLTDLSLIARRRAPIAVVAVFAGFTLAVTLLISPLHALQPANTGNLWGPLGAIVASYAPVRLAGDRRRAIAAFAAVAVLALVTARPWQPSAAVITVGVLRILLGPLVAMYVVTRRRLVLALTERAERAEREQHLLAEQARAEERARLAAESTAVGLPTELVEDGDPRLVSPVVGRTLYRIVQEALTNARKHAPARGCGYRCATTPTACGSPSATPRRPGRSTPAWPAPALAWAPPTCGGGWSWCTGRCTWDPSRTAGSGWTRPCPPTSRRRRCPARWPDRDRPGGGGRRRADGVRPPSDHPRRRRRP
jgi:signal transduction histidine kinase